MYVLKAADSSGWKRTISMLKKLPTIKPATVPYEAIYEAGFLSL
jgi:hypothetical protein